MRQQRVAGTQKKLTVGQPGKLADLLQAAEDPRCDAGGVRRREGTAGDAAVSCGDAAAPGVGVGGIGARVAAAGRSVGGSVGPAGSGADARAAAVGAAVVGISGAIVGAMACAAVVGLCGATTATSVSVGVRAVAGALGARAAPGSRLSAQPAYARMASVTTPAATRAIHRRRLGAAGRDGFGRSGEVCNSAGGDACCVGPGVASADGDAERSRNCRIRFRIAWRISSRACSHSLSLSVKSTSGFTSPGSIWWLAIRGKSCQRQGLSSIGMTIISCHCSRSRIRGSSMSRMKSE